MIYDRTELIQEMADAYKRYMKLSFTIGGTFAINSKNKVEKEQKWLKEIIQKYDSYEGRRHGIV